MDIHHHLTNMKETIQQFNESLQVRNETFPTREEDIIPEKEYKMPFEMKVFKKRVQKHQFYRNRNKTKKKEVVSLDFDAHDHTQTSTVDGGTKTAETTGSKEITEIKTWTSLPTLSKKRKLRVFLRTLDISPNTYKSLYNHIWSTMQTKMMKAKHVELDKNEIIHIHGLGQIDGQWLFNSADLL